MNVRRRDDQESALAEKERKTQIQGSPSSFFQEEQNTRRESEGEHDDKLYEERGRNAIN
jgi:hypothetical protein